METNLICISCPKGCHLKVSLAGENIQEVKGNRCPRGKEYAESEIKDPRRVLTTTVLVKGGRLPVIPVKSQTGLPKGLIIAAMKILRETAVSSPVRRGDIVVENILGTGINIIAARDVASAGTQSKY
ncbi:MAG: molybdopterin oxidoreductase [Firmicutes bacterium HGW-Firmicutes-14]|nr:MAG: molybdopterin oxidoreductase [Firmicutes bacterium HGW-Firmicutes-14]